MEPRDEESEGKMSLDQAQMLRAKPVEMEAT